MNAPRNEWQIASEIQWSMIDARKATRKDLPLAYCRSWYPREKVPMAIPAHLVRMADAWAASYPTESL